MSDKNQGSDALPGIVEEIIAETITFMEGAAHRFTSELRELCDISSSSNDPHGLNDMANYLSNRLEGMDLKLDLARHERGNAVLAELTGENPQAPVILLLGHHDTVYSEGVSAPPRMIQGDQFFGPGAADMKGGLLLALFALEALLRAGYRDFNKLLYLSVPDEEISDRYHVDLLKKVAMEHKPVVLALEESSSIGSVVIKRRGVAEAKLTARGVSAHAGINPHEGRNAALELAYQIVQFCTIADLPQDMSINAGLYRGGTLRNIVPDYAEVTFDVRFFNQQSLEWLLSRWQELMKRQHVKGVELVLSLEGTIIPPMTNRDAELTKLTTTVEAITKQLGVSYDPEIRGGSADAGHTSSYGCLSLDGFGLVGGQAHSPREHILLSAVPKKVALLVATITALTTREKA